MTRNFLVGMAAVVIAGNLAMAADESLRQKKKTETPKIKKADAHQLPAPAIEAAASEVPNEPADAQVPPPNVQEATKAQQADEPQELEPQELEPQETEPQEVVPPTPEELKGQIDSFGEAFVELKNVVDNLNRMRLSGYIQAQYVHDESSLDTLTSATATRNRDQFSVRRARVKFTYQFAPTSRFVLQPDVTSSGVSLKDGYVEFTEPWTTWRNTLTAGQFNWPFGFEIGYSSSSREMPERSRVIRTLFPGERDRGVMLSGRGFLDRFIYQVAIVNGTGTTQSFDFNKRKDFVGRVGTTFGPLDIGVSGYRGQDLVATSTRPAGISFDKERNGVDFQLITPIQGLGVRGEYITGKERGADVDGWYIYLIQNLGTRHQFVVRVDDYDPNTDLSNTTATRSTMTTGGSYIFHWDANSKVMLAYEQPELKKFDVDDDAWTLRYQYSF